jgi:dihydroxyacid dehydratase/phosphogluconate dehydratase
MRHPNILALQTEELLRSRPVDGAVLIGACDFDFPETGFGAPV